MRALLSEAIGTFFLVLVIGLSSVNGWPIAPLAIGAVLMVMVYAGATTSGAHYNPAISLGLVMTGTLPRERLAGYWTAQFAGAMLATFLAWKFTGVPAVIAPAGNATLIKALVAEAVGTFALVYVVAHVIAGKGRAGNGYYGLAIGATVAAMAAGLGPISGGAFNPAVGFGAAIANAIIGHGWQPESWIYVAGPIGGGAAAASVFRYQNAGV